VKKEIREAFIKKREKERFVDSQGSIRLMRSQKALI